MLWEHEPQVSVFTAFSSSPKLPLPLDCFLTVINEVQNTGASTTYAS